MNEKEQIRQDMKSAREDLALALQEIRSEAGNKLDPKDLAEIQKELGEIDVLLKRLESGLVWIALFGKTSVGKSAIAHALFVQGCACSVLACFPEGVRKGFGLFTFC